MSNIAGKAYAMNVITPSHPKCTWFNRFIFMLARSQPAQLKGLLGLSIIHFARWVIIKRDQWPDLGQGKQTLKNDYMLFCSNFNGTWDQYIDAFSDGIPDGLDMFWYSATKYPKSLPVTPFKDYISHNQIYTDYYYNATPGSAQRDIKASIHVYDEVKKLAQRHQDADPATFAAAYREMLLAVQHHLGEPGYAPVASLDTERADFNRRDVIQATQNRLRQLRAAETVVAEPADKHQQLGGADNA